MPAGPRRTETGPRVGLPRRRPRVRGQRARRPGHVCSRRRARGSGATCRARDARPGRGEDVGPGAGDEERAPAAPPAAPAVEPSAGEPVPAAVVAFPGEGGRRPAALGTCGRADTGGRCIEVGGESGGTAPLKEAWRAVEHPDGSVAEWSKALDLGSSHFDGVGSNPTAAKLFCASRAGGSFSPPEV